MSRTPTPSSMPPASTDPAQRTNMALYAVVVLTWGTSWLALKLQVTASDVAVLASVAYRFGFAGVLLLLWCILRGHSLRFSLRQHLLMAMQGIILFGVNYALFYASSAYLTSGLVAVVFSSVILFNIFMGRVVLKNPLDGRVMMGAAFGLAGIVFVFWPEVSAFSLQDAGFVGVLFALGGTVCASIGMTLSVRNQRAGLKVMQTNAFGMSYGAAFLVAVALVTGTPLGFDWSLAYVGGLVYLSVGASIIAFGSYLTLLGRIGPERASYASVVFPIIALGVSTVFEGYQWTPVAFGGVALILFGNLLVLTRRKAAPNTVPAEA